MTKSVAGGSKGQRPRPITKFRPLVCCRGPADEMFPNNSRTNRSPNDTTATVEILVRGLTALLINPVREKQMN